MKILSFSKRVKFWLLGGVVICSAMICFTVYSRFLADRVAHSSEQIRFDTTFHSFGRVSPDQQLVTTFHYTNNTNLPLRLVSITSSCGCLAHVASRELLSPGESGDIVVSLSTLGISPRQMLRKRVRIDFETDRSASIYLEVEAELLEYISIDPAEVTFSDTTPGEVSQASITVRRVTLTREDFSTVHPSSIPDFITLREVGRSCDEIKYDAVLLLRKAPTDLGSVVFTHSVRNTAGMKRVEVPLASNPLSRVTLQPASYLHMLNSKSEAHLLRDSTEKTLRLVSPPGTKYRIASVKREQPSDSLNSAFAWQINKDAQGLTVWIRHIPELPIVVDRLILEFRDEITGRTISNTIPLRTIVKGF